MNQHFVREKQVLITRLDNGYTVATEQIPEVATVRPLSSRVMSTCFSRTKCRFMRPRP